jgi:hypothetical protein
VVTRRPLPGRILCKAYVRQIHIHQQSTVQVNPMHSTARHSGMLNSQHVTPRTLQRQRRIGFWSVQLKWPDDHPPLRSHRHARQIQLQPPLPFQREVPSSLCYDMLDNRSSSNTDANIPTCSAKSTTSSVPSIFFTTFGHASTKHHSRMPHHNIPQHWTTVQSPILCCVSRNEVSIPSNK